MLVSYCSRLTNLLHHSSTILSQLHPLNGIQMTAQSSQPLEKMTRFLFGIWQWSQKKIMKKNWMYLHSCSSYTRGSMTSKKFTGTHSSQVLLSVQPIVTLTFSGVSAFSNLNIVIRQYQSVILFDFYQVNMQVIEFCSIWFPVHILWRFN